MTGTFASSGQERAYKAVLAELKKLGYRGDLLQEGYGFDDWFTRDNDRRVAPAAAFGQTPVGYDSACFGVIPSNGKVGPELISEYRALGAPRAFEVRPDKIVHWRVSAAPRGEDEQSIIPLEQISQVFQDNASRWKPSHVLNAKNVATATRQRLDFVDVGLIPALEQHIKSKLGPLLQDILRDATEEYQKRRQSPPNYDELVRLLFRAITGKVMHDRGVAGFDTVATPPNAQTLLRLVAEHYNDRLPMLSDARTQNLVVDRLWSSFSFRNLSVEVLAYIWEDTFVTDELRTRYGIHATPPAVARYIVHRLPLASIPLPERRVVEPCCGSAVFLVAALQRLRELYPPHREAGVRHRYFKRMLRGYDVETFGLEVARSCLTLADFPNPNGWHLRMEDVFSGTAAGFVAGLKQARVVLCNPPFEDFVPGESDKYQPAATQKPVELLNLVLDHLHPDGVLGFVLPATALDGRSYKQVRRRLAERFAHIEAVRLPDKVFERAEFPCALLMATQPTASPKHRVTVLYSVVTDADRFLRTGQVERTERVSGSPTSIESQIGGAELPELWDYLADNPTVRTAVSRMSRGVEWNVFSRERHISATPKRGYVPGFHTVDELFSFQPPPVSFLWDRPESRRGGAWGLPWHEPKVLMNAVRKARQPWRLAASPFDLNAIASQNFTAAWPIAPWTVNTLSAVLNGPVASAYVNAHESWKHNKKRTLASIPLPVLDTSARQTLETVVSEYRRAAVLAREVGEQAGLFGGFQFEPRLRELLGVIDTIVLRGYGLPPELQKKLFHYFGRDHRLVPFESDIRDVERANKELPPNPPVPPDDKRNDRELVERIMDDERAPGARSLFRWRK